jgi:NitT/TauT family transport system substrate-binding protein
MSLPNRNDFLRTVAATAAASALVPRAAWARDPLTVRIGAAPVEPQAEVFYALDSGAFAKNGIDAKWTPVRSGSVNIESVLAGSLDVGATNAISFGSALIKGLPLVAIAPALMNDARYRNIALAVLPDSPVKSGADLDGKVVAVTSLASLDQLTVSAWMDKNGGDYKSVKYLESTPAAMLSALQQKRVAAAVMYDPELTAADAAGEIRILPGGNDAVAPLYQATLWFTSASFLASSEDAVKRTADALIAGGAWAEANRAASLATLEKYTKIHNDRSSSHYGRVLDPALLQIVFDAAYKYGIFSAPVKAADHCWNGNV